MKAGVRSATDDKEVLTGRLCVPKIIGHFLSIGTLSQPALLLQNAAQNHRKCSRTLARCVCSLVPKHAPSVELDT